MLKKFLSYYKPYLRLFYADMACAIIASAMLLAIPLCIRYITKNQLEPQQIWMMGGLMLLLLAIYSACHAFIDYKGHMMGALMERDMRNELFEHYQKLSFKFYDEHRTGQLMTRISQDTFDMSELFHHGPEDLVISMLHFIGAFVILSFVNVQLALIALVFIPVMGLYGYYFSRKMQTALRVSRDRVGDINSQVEDTLSGIRVVQSFTNEQIEQHKFQVENEKFLNSRESGYRAEAYFYNGMQTFTQLLTITVVIFGSIRIAQGTMDLSDLITFLLYIALLTEPVQRLGNFIRLYQEGVTGFQRFMEVMQVEPEIVDSPTAKPLSDVTGSIIFDHVSFKYREDHEHVLKNLSLHIHSGEFVALVGPSGIGKTTLCSLIPRFYETREGNISIDGQDIRDVTLHSLRSSIGMVPQDTYLFSGSILDNIRYGKPDATDEEIFDAAKKANAHNFILALPQGYATDVGQRGVKLSGGQKQRVSIARAFLKNPAILILDEATSALDNESERAVQESLERLIKNRTTLVIAHRLTTIKHAKRILVLTEDGIVEQGTHDQLIAQNGAYANLYNLQVRIEDAT